MGLNAWLIQLIMQYKWELATKDFPCVCCWANCLELAVNRPCWHLASSNCALFFHWKTACLPCPPAHLPIPAQISHPFIHWSELLKTSVIWYWWWQSKQKAECVYRALGMAYGMAMFIVSIHFFFWLHFYADWEQKITSRGIACPTLWARTQEFIFQGPTSIASKCCKCHLFLFESLLFLQSGIAV